MGNILFGIFNAHTHDYKGVDFVSSSLVSPGVLLGVRVFFFLFSSATYIASSATGSLRSFEESYRYLTNLSFIGVILYFTLASFTSLRFVRNKYDSEPLDSQWRVFKWLHWNLYLIQITYQPVIVVVYWLLLSAGVGDDNQLQWYFNVSKHGLMFLLIWIDWSLNRIPVYASQWTGPFFVAILYLSWGLLQTLFYNGFKAYFFFDTGKMVSAAYLIGILVVTMIVYFACSFGLTILKDRLWNSKGPIGIDTPAKDCEKQEIDITPPEEKELATKQGSEITPGEKELVTKQGSDITPGEEELGTVDTV
ncbi:MAG: hypothetical protein SGCHY_002261 [Lobulomycetales sp.]